MSSGQRIRALVVFGTRPEAIKMAPVVRALAAVREFEPIVAVTAQHREMLDQVLTTFAIRPDYDLDLMRHGQTLSDVAVGSIKGLESVLAETRPHVVLVHGDTLTTFAGALAAFYAQVPVAHVEAGLRTADRYNPFPEEMNRRLTGALAEFHFAPTETAKQNLLREAVPANRIWVTGNTVIDALLATVKPDYRFTDPALARIDFSAERVILVTTHRRENLGAPMQRIYRALRKLVHEFSDVRVVFALHKNPAVRSLAQAELGNVPRVDLIEPPAYEEFANLMNQAHLIITDSGGVQEEAPALGKPVLVARETTERPEGVAAGTLVLVGTDTERIVEQARRLLQDRVAYDRMAKSSNPYGDGQAAQRIVSILRDHLSDVSHRV